MLSVVRHCQRGREKNAGVVIWNELTCMERGGNQFCPEPETGKKMARAIEYQYHVDAQLIKGITQGEGQECLVRRYKEARGKY